MRTKLNETFFSVVYIYTPENNSANFFFTKELALLCLLTYAKPSPDRKMKNF